MDLRVCLRSDEGARVDAIALAARIRRGEVTAREAVEESIARIERLDPKINAVTSRLFEQAIEAADSPNLPNGPLRGVPTLLKDLGPGLKGMPEYNGNRLFKESGATSKIDGVVAGKLRDAGAIVVGKSASPEFGTQPTTQPLAFGPTHNPWDLERSVSGSSGGSAAAVAAGMVPFAHATDGAGSIRQPASWCGLVGLKPSRGRIARGGRISRWGTELIVSKSVRDTALALDIASGPGPGELYRIELPARPYINEIGADPGSLRVGLLTSVDAAGVVIHEESIAAAQNAAKLLESLGHHVEEAGPERLFDDEFLEKAEVDYAGVLRHQLKVMLARVGADFAAESVEPYTWARAERMAGLSSFDQLQAMAWVQQYAIRISKWWQTGYDLLITPTTGRPPAKLADLIPSEADPWAIDHEKFSQIRSFVRPFNPTGQPAISLPLHWTKEGLPQGVQLVADMGREDLLIRVASQLEEAQPWAHRKPSLR